MRSRIAMAIGSLMLVLSLMGMTHAAAAAGAEQIRLSGCDSSEYLGDIYEYCYDTNGVSQRIVTPGGLTKISANYRTVASLTVNGTLVETYESQSHFTDVIKPGVTQVSQSLARGSTDYVDASGQIVSTCTYSYNLLYVNNEWRITKDEFACGA